MKLPDFLESPALNQLRHLMGNAPLPESIGPDIAVKAIDLTLLERRLQDAGIDISVDEVEELEHGTLGYQNKRVLLYIRDAPRSEPKYHIAYCSWLKEKKLDGRISKYVATSGVTGEFLVRLKGDTELKRIRLDVCQWCLTTLDWKGFTKAKSEAERRRRVAEFSLPEFFEQYPSDLIPHRPTHTAETAPPNEYPQDWKQISWRTRKAKNFRCEKCLVNLLPSDYRFLDVHHRNGLKYDSSLENLQVLCIGCHAEEPEHENLKKDSRYDDYLKKYRSV